MVQLWVNLPKAHKMSAPRYQGITKDQIPVVQLGGGSYARVIAGELSGIKGPAKTFTPLNVFDVHLVDGTKLALPLPEGQKSVIALLRGAVRLNGSTPVQGEAQLAALSGPGDLIEIEATADTMLLVLSGEAIEEPVTSYGPFVMNTQDEIRQAIEDYRAGKMGQLN